MTLKKRVEQLEDDVYRMIGEELERRSADLTDEELERIIELGDEPESPEDQQELAALVAKFKPSEILDDPRYEVYFRDIPALIDRIMLVS
ncbi:hypothetical protein MTYM_00050 [Methylococcales bacterium]|nr:hypothetical protein MTYM_00050 [Methylococcales bacterium]